MSENGAIESIEIERKYEVSAAAELPTPGAFAGVGLRAGASSTHELQASYFDTEAAALAMQRIALRRRSGGKDAGWHLKMKVEGSAHEMLWPLAQELPQGLRNELELRLAPGEIERLRTIAQLRTTRIITPLFDVEGTQVVELADDRVEATNEITGAQLNWREWEAELIPGADEVLLDAVEPVLVSAGAKRLRGTSKIQRVMQAGADSEGGIL